MFKMLLSSVPMLTLGSLMLPWTHDPTDLVIGLHLRYYLKQGESKFWRWDFSILFESRALVNVLPAVSSDSQSTHSTFYCERNLARNRMQKNGLHISLQSISGWVIGSKHEYRALTFAGNVAVQTKVPWNPDTLQKLVRCEEHDSSWACLVWHRKLRNLMALEQLRASLIALPDLKLFWPLCAGLTRTLVEPRRCPYCC